MNVIAGTETIVTVIGAIIIQALTVAAAYWRFRNQLHSVKDEVKSHTDASILKLNGMLSYFLAGMDRPAWIKLAKEEKGEIKFVMVEINDHYADIFGIPRKDYIGRTDLEAGWPKEIADKFHENDLMVWATGKPQTFVEDVQGRKMEFRKVRLESPEGGAKGIMGYSVEPYTPSRIPRRITKVDKQGSDLIITLECGHLYRMPDSPSARNFLKGGIIKCGQCAKIGVN